MKCTSSNTKKAPALYWESKIQNWTNPIFVNLIIILFSLFAVKLATAGSVTADFSVDNQFPVVDETITFQDRSSSEGLSELGIYDWDFDKNASPRTSVPGEATTVGPHEVYYTTAGNKTVELYLTSISGQRDDTKTMTIYVGAAPTPGSIGGTQSICSGDTPGLLTSVTDGGGSVNTSISYQWQTNASGSFVTIGEATGATYQPPPLTSTTSYQRRTVTDWGDTTRYSAWTTPVTVTVNPINTVDGPSSTPEVCSNTAITPITHTTTGATGIGTPANLPQGVSASWASNTITISGTPTESGVFNYSIPLTGGCGIINATGTITVNALPEAPNAINVTTTYDGTPNSASAVVNSGEVIDWYTAQTGGTATTAPSGTNAGSYSAWAEVRNTTTGCVSATRTEVTLTINKANQYIIFGIFPFTKPLNEFINEPVPLNITASSGLDVEVELEPGSAAVLNGSPGNYYLTDIGTTGNVVIQATQSGNENYNAAVEVIRSFDVTLSNQSISFPEIDDLTYSGGLILELDAVASSGLAVSYAVASGPATIINGNELEITGAGEIWVTASQSGNASYNPASDVIRSFIVNKGIQTITINMTPDDPITSSTEITATSTSDLPVTLTLGAGSDATSLVNNGSFYTLTGIGSIGTGQIYLIGNQAGDDNFLPAVEVIQTIDLGKSNQTIDFTSISNKVFGDSPLTLVATASSLLPVSFALVSGPATLDNDELTLTGAGTVIVEANQAGDGFYNPAPTVTRQFEVIKATPVITQSDISITYDENDPDLELDPGSSNPSGSFSFVSGNDDVFTISGNTASITGAGNTILVITQQPTANYFGAVKTVNFIVNRAFSSITVTGDTEYTYNASPQGPETYVSSGSDGTVTFSYEGTGSTVYGPIGNKPTKAGTYAATATLAGNENYEGADSEPFAFTILRAASTIEVTGNSEFTYNGQPQGPGSVNISGSTGAVSYLYQGTGSTTYSPSAVKPTNAGDYEVIATIAEDENYESATSEPFAFSIIKADANITVSPYDVVYNGQPHTSAFTATGVEAPPADFSALIDVSATTHTDAGTYTDDDWSFAGNENYNPASGDVTNIIRPRDLTVTANNQAKCFGAEIITDGTGFSSTGLVTGESIGSVTLSSDGFSAGATEGFYTISPSNATGENPFNPANYNITYVEGQLSVKPLPTLAGASLSSPVCSGSGATISLTGLLPGKSFSLDYSINGVDQPTKTGLSSDASGNESFTTTTLSESNDGQILQITEITVTNETPGCSQNFSGVEVTLRVNALPTLDAASQDGIACDGSPAIINLTGLIVNTTFSLGYTIDGGDQTLVENITADGSGNASFSTTPLTITNDGNTLQIIGILITSETPNCTQGFEKNVILKVAGLPTATISGNASICENDFTTISVDFTGTGPWEITTQRNGGDDVTITNIDMNSYTFDVSQEGVYTVSAVSDANCTGTTSGSATVTVHPLPATSEIIPD